MAASSGVRCATFFDAASTFLNNDATVPEESAARPKLLPASEMKSRRVRSCTSLIRAIPQTACNHCLRLLSSSPLPRGVTGHVAHPISLRCLRCGGWRANGVSDIEHVATKGMELLGKRHRTRRDEGNGAFGKSDIEG